MNPLKTLRAFAQGAIDESALTNPIDENNEDISAYENDEQFMQECTQLCMPTMMLMEMLGESAEELDESVVNAIHVLDDYLRGQGLISEAASAPRINAKINVVHLNKNAQLARLKTIIVLKMARKDNVKAYQKYKMGQKIKKMNMAEMVKRYGAKAEKLAKKLWQRTHKNGKVVAVVKDEQSKVAKKSK